MSRWQMSYYCEPRYSIQSNLYLELPPSPPRRNYSFELNQKHLKRTGSQRYQSQEKDTRTSFWVTNVKLRRKSSKSPKAFVMPPKPKIEREPLEVLSKPKKRVFFGADTNFTTDTNFTKVQNSVVVP